MKFEKNVGEVDRVVRAVVGALLIGAAVLADFEVVLRLLLGLAGAVLIATAVLGSCMLYSVLGINTSKK
ncbi:MAG: DUF2892 domain-containing protein [Candidatus Anstonellaceae archaeon]